MRSFAVWFWFKHIVSVVPIVVSLVIGASANAQSGVVDAITAGLPLIDLRLRYENVDQENKPRNASALTFRARLGYQTGQYHGFAALAEFDAVQHLGPQ